MINTCLIASCIVTILCAKNETRIILNILYSCKSVAMKFSTWYADDLSYWILTYLPPHLSYVSTLPDYTKTENLCCVCLNSV